jgi:hypothetical protein
MIGLLVSFVMAGTTLVPAQAGTAKQPPTGERRSHHVTSSGSGGTTSHDGQHSGTVTQVPGLTAGPSLAEPPTSWPAPRNRYLWPNQYPPCSSGYGCAAVPWAGQYYIFDFYYYETYALSDWLGRGTIHNNQTGGAAVRLLNRDGSERHCIPTGVGRLTVDWTPIWYIRLTPSRC